MAFDILPPNLNLTSGTSNSSGAKNSGTDIFSIDLGAAKQPTPAPKPAPAPKPPQASAKRSASNSKSSSAQQQPSSAANPDKSAAQSTAAADNSHSQPADQKSQGDSSSSADSKPRVSVQPKGRPIVARAPAKSASAAAQQAQEDATDPGVDSSNSSGLSLLQLLAKSLEGGDSTATAAASKASDSSAAASSDSATARSTDAGNGDPNAMALSMLTQALAAAFGATPPPATPGASGTAAGPADSGSLGIADATQAAKGGLGEELAALLAQKLTADASSKADSDSSQTNVTADRGDAVQSGSDSGKTAAGALPHLGIASHFSLQQTATPSIANTGDLKSQVGSSDWNDELGAHLTWMTQKGLESGSLRVSPEHLGPVEVQISVQNGDASVWFGASHADTRAALEQALPRLREMFASQGMTLTDSGVSRESPRNQTRSSSPQAISAITAAGSADVSVPATVRATLGLVDTYA